MRIDVDFRPLLLKGNAQEIGSELAGWAENGLTVRVVRGRKMRSLGGLFDEFSAALQFPLYFGENKDAFDECIADLEALRPGRGYVVAVSEPELVLVDEDSAALSWLAGSLAGAGEEWAQSIELGEWWDRPAVPFHVVLVVGSDQVADTVRRWRGAGADPLLLAARD